jgi:hypothetical protein
MEKTKMAVQKFCAISLGYTCTTSSQPPFTPGTLSFGRLKP